MPVIALRKTDTHIFDGHNWSPRRGTRPERHDWRNAGIALCFERCEAVDVRGVTFTSRPYLVVHPEREIAEVTPGQHPSWRCEACKETAAYPGKFIFMTHGEVLLRAMGDVERHNAERHPRRWARSQQLTGQVALDEARRVTRWGADA